MSILKCNFYCISIYKINSAVIIHRRKMVILYGIPLYVNVGCSLLYTHLLDKPLSTTHLVNYEQYVADVADDVAAQGLVELNVGHC